MVYGGSQGTSQIVASSFFLLLALITVILRLVVRVGNLKTFGIDDGLICAALCCSVAHLGLIVLEVMHGQGRTDNLPHDQITILKRAIYISIPIYCTALALTKLAILFLYLRFFQGKFLRRFTIGLIVFVSAYGKSWTTPYTIMIAHVYDRVCFYLHGHFFMHAHESILGFKSVG